MTDSIDKYQHHFQKDEAMVFLELLGKDPADTWLRCIKPGRNGASEHQGLDSRWIDIKSDAGYNLYAVIGNATTATGKGGGVQDTDITNVPALFVEWDDGASIEEQIQRWQSLKLPEPTVMVSTGGKSVHCYWVLQQPLPPLEWKRITARLIAHSNSDPQCSNPSRVMRLPGSIYYDKKTGEHTGKCRILSGTDTRYSAAEIEDCLPAPAPTPVKPAAVEASRKWEPRSIEEINAAAEFIPERRVGEGTYPESRNALCGCSAALAEAGAEDPDGMALALLGHLWPDEGTARQVLKTTTTREAGSFWAIARDNGYDLSVKSKPQQYPSSFLGLIKDLEDGWTDKGKTRPLTAGHLSKLLPNKVLSFNEMDLRAYIETRTGPKAITEADIDSAFVLLSCKGWRTTEKPLSLAIFHVARKNTIHPLRQYLELVESDSTLKAFDLNAVAPCFFRASDSLYVEMVRKWLIGAVARVFEPGCQMDYVLTLQSDVQGLGKSQLFRALASPEWFCSSTPDDDKDLILNIHTCWLFELAELEAITGRKNTGRLKNLITTCTDRVRIPFGRLPEPMKRTSVFCATVNKRDFLCDDTGNRRFWVVPIQGAEKLDRAGLVENRDAIWKAAVLAYREGEVPMLSDEFENASEQQNDNYREYDPWLPLVTDFLQRRMKEKQVPVQTSDILECIGIPGDRWSPRESKRVREIAVSLGWEYNRKRINQVRVQGLWPPMATYATQVATQADPSDTNGCAPLATYTTQKTINKSNKEEVEGRGAPTQKRTTENAFLGGIAGHPPDPFHTKGSEWPPISGHSGLVGGQPPTPALAHGERSLEELELLKKEGSDYWDTEPCITRSEAGKRKDWSGTVQRMRALRNQEASRACST